MGLSKSQYEQNKLALKDLFIQVGIKGSQTQGSIQAYCKNIGDVLIYHEDDTRTVTAVDSGIGFALTDLDNDAPPAVLGALVPVGDASELVEVSLVAGSIKSVNMSAPATALGTVVFGGAAAAANAPTHDSTAKTGVTVNGNIAFTFALTSLDIDEDNATAENNSFWLHVKYRPTQPNY